MYLPLYAIFYTINNELEEKYFYTTKAARDFLWNNRNKIHNVSIYLFSSGTELSEKDLRD